MDKAAIYITVKYRNYKVIELEVNWKQNEYITIKEFISTIYCLHSNFVFYECTTATNYYNGSNVRPQMINVLSIAPFVYDRHFSS